MSGINQELANFVLPQAPIKTLWFEFLLSPDLLEKHLLAFDCDPSPVDLIVQFMNNASAAAANIPPPTPTPIPINAVNGNGDEMVNGKKSPPSEPEEDPKSFALKMLAIKVLSFMKWDLNFIEKRLSLPMQFTLINELTRLCCDQPAHCGLFAYITYYRWLIRTVMKVNYPLRPQKGSQLAIPLIQQIDPLFVPHDVMDTLMKKLGSLVDAAAEGLEKIVQENSGMAQFSINRPLIDCFCLRPVTFYDDDKAPSFCDWKQIEKLEAQNLLDELRHELGRWFFHNESYQKSNEYFESVTMTRRNSFEHLDDYLSSTRKMLEMSTLAELEVIEPTAYLEDSLKQILRGGSCDLTFVERRLEPSVIGEIINKFYAAAERTCPERQLLKNLALYLSRKINGLKGQIAFLAKKERSTEYGQPVEVMEVDSQPLKSHQLKEPESGEEDGEIEEENVQTKENNEQILLESIDPETILSLCTRIDKYPQLINRNWAIAPAHATCLHGAHPGLYRKCHIVLAKANELRRAHLFIESRTLYRSLLEDVQASLPDLAQVILGEILRTDLEHYFTTNDVDERVGELLEKCHNVLLREKFVMEITPELVDLSCVFMLNLVIFSLSERKTLKDSITRMSEYTRPNSPMFNNPMVRLSGRLFCAASEGALTGKTSKDLFEDIASALAESVGRSHPKRVKHHVGLPTMSPAAFTAFVTKLKSFQGNALTEAPQLNSPVDIVASALIKLYNVVRDGSTLANTDVTLPSLRIPITWPANLSPPPQKKFELSTISKALHALLDKLLEQKPMEINWIRAKAELALIEDKSTESLRHFVNLIVITTEYFTVFTGTAEEEETINRMIMAVTKLNCHTEAAVLYQMTSKPNYQQAFKALSERTCYDSCEHLYECIWDTNMLEYLVSLHSRRGEVDRKTKALQLIGQLELNANNNMDILREAASVRKAKFFRILSKKYL